MNAFSRIDSLLKDKSIVLVGFGREGKALILWLIKRYPDQRFCVADRAGVTDPEWLQHTGRIDWKTGENYLSGLESFDVIIKTPGIPLSHLSHLPLEKVTSQTELFLLGFAKQTIGITGTKGKSTTSSLIHHIIKQFRDEALLVGNIGIPPFSIVDQLDADQVVVMELSSHQLELVRHSPHIAVFLNLFEEHLDHYDSFADYQKAKYNIALFQTESDYFIFNTEDPLIDALIKSAPHKGLGVGCGAIVDGRGVVLRGDSIVFRNESDEFVLVDNVLHSPLKGRHNVFNLMAATAACYLAGVPAEVIRHAIAGFKPLEHRLEPVGIFGGIEFFNDSISTIPEATLAAIDSLGGVHTLLLGGHDRGIDYHKLLEIESGIVKQLLFTGTAGQRMMKLIENEGQFEGVMRFFSTFSEMVAFACHATPVGSKCLLSPAASSYDQFANFEERGKRFRDLVKQFLGCSQE